MVWRGILTYECAVLHVLYIYTNHLVTWVVCPCGGLACMFLLRGVAGMEKLITYEFKGIINCPCMHVVHSVC